MAPDHDSKSRIGLRTRLLWFISLVPPLFLLDLVSKRLVLKHMVPYGPTVELIDGIARLRFIYNEGIAFGINPSFLGTSALAAFSVLVALLMTGYLFFAWLGEKPILAALCLIVSGACGNLYDRIAWGRVVDFIEIGIGDVTWPVFNVADLAVTAGALLLAWRMFATEKNSSAAQNKNATDSESV
jgi:signal peptidase II